MAGGEAISDEMNKAKCSKNWELFKSWMLKYNKSYESDEEILRRFKIFSNAAYAVEKGNKEYFGITKFKLNYLSDLTLEEMPLGRSPSPLRL